MTAAQLHRVLARAGIVLLLIGLLVAAIFYAGKLHERAAWNKKTTQASEAARVTERDGAAIANTAETDHQASRKQQQENADAELKTLRAQLALEPRCPVSRRAVRLLDGRPDVPATATTAAVTGRTPAAVEADATEPTVEARAVIEHCAINRLTVCEPNATHVEDLQRFYNQLRDRFNRP